MTLLRFALCLCLVGCTSTAASDSVTRHEATERVGGEASQGDERWGAAGRATPAQARPPVCDRLAARFAERLASAAGSCRVDSECGVYPSGIEVCDDVSDRATVLALDRIAARYYGAGCSATVRCAAHRREPACVDRRCVDRLASAP